MNLDLAQTGERMKPPRLGGNQLHVLDEHRDDWHTSFVRNVMNSWLAGPDMNAIPARSFRKNNQLEFFACASKSLQLFDSFGIQFAAFQEEAYGAAQNCPHP